MRLFDTHTHLQDREFDRDRSDVLTRAREAGVAGLLVLGTNAQSSADAVALAEMEPGVLAAAGCHPHDAKGLNDEGWSRLTQLARHPRVAAIGEIGLDFYRNFSPREMQFAVFQRQLSLASDVAKPVAIHCREAHDELLPIVARWSRSMGGTLPDGRPLGVMHYFSGDAELAARYVELGFLISVHTSVTYPKAEQLRDVARSAGLENLVVETDSPYGAPQSRRGTRNEPANVWEAAAEIAELRGESVEAVAEATTENALRLFVAAGAGEASQDAQTEERSSRCA